MKIQDREIDLSFEQKIISRFIPACLIICLVFSLGLFLTRPIPHGHRYDLALKLTIELMIVWMVFSYEPHWLSRKTLIVLILIVGIGLGVYQLKTIKSDPEIIETYRSVFKDLEEGRNPYTSGQIYHRNEANQVVYQNFNYPPMELYPYWLFYRMFRVWNPQSLTLFLIILQLLAGIILILTFRRIRPFYLLAFLPLLVFSEIKTNPAMTMLSVSIFMALLFRQETRPSTLNRYLIAVVIGFGLLTKFLFIPLAGVYYFLQLDFRSWKNSLKVISEGFVSLLVAWLLMLPFGPWNVIKSTILFNLNLGERNIYTTFYPNVLSGFFYLIKKPELYPLVAVVIMVAAVLLATRLKPFSAMLLSGIAFLLVSPTPEPQYFGTMLLLALAAKMMEIYSKPDYIFSHQLFVGDNPRNSRPNTFLVSCSQCKNFYRLSFCLPEIQRSGEK